jgi:hypothetical protein
MATVISTVRRRYDPAAIMLELRNGRQLYSLRLPTVVFESSAARLAAWLLSIESGAARKMELRMREPPGEPDFQATRHRANLRGLVLHCLWTVLLEPRRLASPPRAESLRRRNRGNPPKNGGRDTQSAWIMESSMSATPSSGRIGWAHFGQIGRPRRSGLFSSIGMNLVFPRDR